MSKYHEFLKKKRFHTPDSGFAVVDMNPALFDWQRAIVKWAIRKGKAAIFADCGLGKTLMQLEWAFHVCHHTGGSVLILAPLAVAEQTALEGAKFGIPVTVCRHGSDVRHGINVTNYEMLHGFDTSLFVGIVLDESSILKSHDSKTRNALMDAFSVLII